jgi:hypothetical protein
LETHKYRPAPGDNCNRERAENQNAFPIDVAILLRLCLQDRKDQLLLAHIGGALNIEILADQCQITDLLLFEGLKIQATVFQGFGIGISSSATDHKL